MNWLPKNIPVKANTRVKRRDFRGARTELSASFIRMKNL